MIKETILPLPPLVYRECALEVEVWRDDFWWVKRSEACSDYAVGTDFNPELDNSVRLPWWWWFRSSYYRQSKAHQYRCFDDALQTMMAMIDRKIAKLHRTAEIEDRMRSRIAIVRERNVNNV